MNKLPEKFEEKTLELFTPYTSEGTIKNRRNLLVASFTIIAIYFIDKSITDLKTFGLDLQGTNSSNLIIIAITIIMFWLIMFLLHAYKDIEINQERSRVLKSQIKALEDNIESTKKTHLNDPKDSTYKASYDSAIAEYKKYETHRSRLKTANRLKKATYIIEYTLPILTTLGALYYLVNDYLNVVST